MGDILELNGVVWELYNYHIISDGNTDAVVYESTSHPDIVLMLINGDAQYKIDWFDYLNLILGRSRYGDKHVLILPRMIEASRQEWISWMQTYYNGSPEDDWIPEEYEFAFGDIEIREKLDLLELLLENEYRIDVSGSDKIVYWTEKILEFLDRYPEYQSLWFDIGLNNFMVYNGDYILIDPINDNYN